jgi:hypothetical protein
MKENEKQKAGTNLSVGVETGVINFFAEISKENKTSNSIRYIRFRNILKNIIQETMKNYFRDISEGKRYIHNIDFHLLPLNCAEQIINKFSDESKFVL